MIHISDTEQMPEENCCAGDNVKHRTQEQTSVLQQGKVTDSRLEEEHYTPNKKARSLNKELLIMKTLKILR